MPNQDGLGQLEIKVRAQLLRELLSRWTLLLQTHSGGHLIIPSEQVDEAYIKLRRLIEDLLQTDGFEGLHRGYSEKGIPESLHSLGDEADLDFEGYISNALNKFKGEVLEFCVDVGAIPGDAKDFETVLDSYDKFIESFRKEKNEEEKRWLQRVERQADKFKQQSGNVNPPEQYVDASRIEELRKIKAEKFDLSKLIELCEELNKSYGGGSYLAVAMLMRAVLDHVPPIFGCQSFAEVANNYGGAKSFKESMVHLDNSLRKIADAHLHGRIRKTETLPNKTQVNFSSELDVLLAEIVRILK